MHSSTTNRLDGCTAGHLSSFQPNLVPSNVDASGVSLQKDGESMTTLPDGSYYSRGNVGPSLMGSNQMELHSYRDGTSGRLPKRRQTSPASISHDHQEWNQNNQVKRARVENIIKGMTTCPFFYCTDETANEREEEKVQELCLHQKHIDRSRSDSLGQNQEKIRPFERQNEHLRRLRTKFPHMEGVTVTSNSSKEDKHPMRSRPPKTPPEVVFADSYSELETELSNKSQGWKKMKVMDYFQTRPERIKLIADALKYELSRAVSRSVDSILKSMPLLPMLPQEMGNTKTDPPCQSMLHAGSERGRDCGSEEVPGSQTEALSLVIQKPKLKRSDQLVLQSSSRTHHQAKSDVPFSHESDRDQGPEQNIEGLRSFECLQDRHSVPGQSQFDLTNTHWSPVKVRSKVNSRSVRRPQASVSVDAILLESLRSPHVKMEPDSLMKNSLYFLNEGLTTSHLKKAKLMFFYTRYPSSLVLKMCFHDVQFTRCITSQLIKWFSNFREFYYIQMEKFARQALVEGAADVRTLTVGRESELFRALNMHYNKANDFQVPDRFLEVAEITLREFYVAISLGKDRDPSWKKAIYKVISKQDSDVPAVFKSQI